jgi:mannose-6-phosphate isomerase-like protein (cupin superfamily)
MGKQNQLIPRNAYIPLHSHQRTEETFRFMDPVKFYIDGKTICFPEGGEITVPVGSIHGTFPTENGIAKLLAEKPCLAPGDFYPAEKKPF